MLKINSKILKSSDRKFSFSLEVVNFCQTDINIIKHPYGLFSSIFFLRFSRNPNSLYNDDSNGSAPTESCFVISVISSCDFPDALKNVGVLLKNKIIIFFLNLILPE